MNKEVQAVRKHNNLAK